MGEIQVDLEKSNRRMLPRIVQELEAKQVWQVPPALLWTCEERWRRREMVIRMRLKIALLLFLEGTHNHARCHHGRCHHGRCPSPQAALYEAGSIMTPQPNMSMTSEASTMRWKMPRRDEATAVRKDSVRFLAAPWVSYFGQYKWKPHEIIHIFMKVKNRHTTL